MKRMIDWIGMVAVITGLAISAAVASDGAVAREHLTEALASAEEMIVHLQEGQMGVFIKHAGDFIMHAKAAIKEIPGGTELGEEAIGHLKMAISEAEEALEQGEADHEDVAVDHALAALSHAEEARSFADAL